MLEGRAPHLHTWPSPGCSTAGLKSKDFQRKAHGCAQICAGHMRICAGHMRVRKRNQVVGGRGKSLSTLRFRRNFAPLRL